MGKWIAAGLFFLLLLGAAGYFAFRFIVRRQKPAAAKLDPGKAKTPARKHYLAHYDEAIARLEAFGCERVSLQAQDGLRLAGYVFRAKRPTNRWVLGVHGYRSAALLEYPFMAPVFLTDVGANLLLVDNRAHGESEGQNISFGHHEQKDTAAWAAWLVEQYGEAIEILLVGISMGAATVLLAGANPALPRQVVGVVADCGYTSMLGQLRHVVRRMRLPAFPLLPLASLWSRVLARFGFGAVDVEAACRRLRVPVLLIHGEADNYVPTHMVHTLHAACPGEKQLLLVPSAAHADSFLTDPALYTKTLVDFAAQVFSDSGKDPSYE